MRQPTRHRRMSVLRPRSELGQEWSRSSSEVMSSSPPGPAAITSCCSRPSPGSLGEKHTSSVIQTIGVNLHLVSGCVTRWPASLAPPSSRNTPEFWVEEASSSVRAMMTISPRGTCHHYDHYHHHHYHYNNHHHAGLVLLGAAGAGPCPQIVNVKGHQADQHLNHPCKNICTVAKIFLHILL